MNTDGPNGPSTSLTSAERGFLLGAGLLGSLPAGLAPPSERRVGTAWAELAALTREERARLLAEWAGDVATPPWSAMARLHPSWIEQALAEEPSRIVAAVVAGMPAGVREVALRVLRARAGGGLAQLPADVDRDTISAIGRLVFGSLADLAAPAGPAGTLGQRLGSLDFADLEREAVTAGSAVLGRSLGGAPVGVLARAMAAAGPPWAERIEAASRESADPVARADARRLVELAVGEDGDAVARLAAIGIGAVARELGAEGDDSVAWVAGRLPAGLGRRLIDLARATSRVA